MDRQGDDDYDGQRSFDGQDEQFDEYKPGKSYDQGGDGPLSGIKKGKAANLAMSVMPSGGQFISNPKKMQKGKNLAQSVGAGLGEDGSLKNLGSLVQDGGILGNLADDANLPQELDDMNRDSFNMMNFCELCDRNFAKLKGINRHHCRKCNRSVCQQCSNSKRRLAKNDETQYRVCDFCDTQLSNAKLEQNQLAILKAQEEQMEMYMTQLQYLDQQKDLEEQENQANQKKLQDFLQRELEKKKKLDEEVKKLEERTGALTETRTELFRQLGTQERLLEDKKEERNELKTKVEIKQVQLENKQRELDEKEEEVRQLRDKLLAVQQRQSNQTGGQEAADHAGRYDEN